MRVKLNEGMFDMSLTGRETQEAFSDEKYRALAGGSPAGKMLQILVDDHWLSWLEVVENAPWLRNWSRSPLYTKKNAQAQARSAQGVDGMDSPSGGTVDGARWFAQRKIAQAIYAEAVWGYGMADWLRGKHIRAGTDARTKANTALRTIYNLQGLVCPSPSRNFTWDDKIYRGCGLLIPCEFGELDRWLEPLWQEALAEVAVSKTRDVSPATTVYETV